MKREKERKSNGESASDREIYLKKKKKEEETRKEWNKRKGWKKGKSGMREDGIKWPITDPSSDSVALSRRI